jgi:Flp pilus assembly protein TadD
MERCPLCRAMLNGADTCRRCRAELQSAQRVQRESQVLADAAMHCLALDDLESAEALLRRALLLHAAPEVRALWRMVEAQYLYQAP